MKKENVKKEKKEVEQEETPVEPTSPTPVEDNGNKEEPEAILKIKKLLEDNEKVLEETKMERERAEKAASEMLYQGRSTAGQAPEPVETADEKWAREAKLRYAGTGMDPTPDAPQ